MLAKMLQRTEHQARAAYGLVERAHDIVGVLHGQTRVAQHAEEREPGETTRLEALLRSSRNVSAELE